MKDPPPGQREDCSYQDTPDWIPPSPPVITPSKDKSSFGIKPNIISGVSYLLIIAPCFAGFLLNLFILIMEKESKYVKFHATQAMFLQLVIFIFILAMNFLSYFLTMFLLLISHSSNFTVILAYLPYLPIALVLTSCLVCAIMAFMKKRFKLPFVGRIIAANVGI